MTRTEIKHKRTERNDTKRNINKKKEKNNKIKNKTQKQKQKKKQYQLMYSVLLHHHGHSLPSLYECSLLKMKFTGTFLNMNLVMKVGTW